MTSLEKALHSYTLSPAASADPFDMKSIPAAQVADDQPKASQVEGSLSSTKGGHQEKPSATRHDMFVERLAAVPEITALNLGQLFKSSQPAELIGMWSFFSLSPNKKIQSIKVYTNLQNLRPSMLCSESSTSTWTTSCCSSTAPTPSMTSSSRTSRQNWSRTKAGSSWPRSPARGCSVMSAEPESVEDGPGKLERVFSTGGQVKLEIFFFKLPVTYKNCFADCYCP